ncbi:uncharacterized GPI-anchored protein At4g28100-like [Prosopis cineraria]|uniref:uncharacterized GPI-anchored protein At4g28100-like n=1 Tax=Prosopis cineraria TaxID=364024 RepID=UPI002410820D|nr:uncharacterized GPI-anchored protein At4g28100-like [Prosopis cineraria]
MQSFRFILAFLICFFSILTVSLAGLLSQPVHGEDASPSTIQAAPVQTPSQNCRLELSKELFGGVDHACGKDLDRSRCCPVLAAWLFAAHARSALEVWSSAAATGGDLPMMPDDSQKCVNSLHDALLSHNIRIPSPNASCDTILCFCGIRLHQISSLTCPAAFNVSASHNATPTSAVTNLEKTCRNSSYVGCTKCLAALQKVKGYKKESERGRSKMLNRDCQLMGLTWLLARNKTAYIPTVSAVLRAIMYSGHTQESKCSPDQDNMPLAVDSLQFDNARASSSPFTFWVPLPLLTLFVLISAFP